MNMIYLFTVADGRSDVTRECLLRMFCGAVCRVFFAGGCALYVLAYYCVDSGLEVHGMVWACVAYRHLCHKIVRKYTS